MDIVMTTYQPDPDTVSAERLSSDALTNELLENTTQSNHAEVVETVISSLDQDQSAMVSHQGNGYLWKFKYGSVEVFVQLTGSSDEDTFTAWATVLKFPVQNEAQLMRQLLEMNWAATFEARFAIMDEQIVVVASRTVAELSPGEISRAITVVASIADENDDRLQAEFGAA